MASSASTLLKVELQATGENDSTWGDKINAALSRLEEGIAGMTSVSVTTADVTLTDTQYVANEARGMILYASGAMTAARSIIVPARTKVYVVHNACTGGFALTVEASGGSGVVVPVGKAIVYCDGTDVVGVVDTDTVVDIVNDTTPQAGGDLDMNAFDIQFDTATGIRDDSDNEQLIFTKTASAVNYLNATNAATGNAPKLSAAGGDTNIDLVLAAKGSGTINLQDAVLQRPELKDYAESLSALGNISTTQALSCAVANTFSATVTGAVTLSFTNPPATGRLGSITLVLTNGGAFTVTWPTSVDWAGAVAPTLTASGVDILTFFTIDGGTTWFGFTAGLAMA